MTVVQFPKQPRSRRRFTYWATVLWPFFALLLFFIVLAVFTHHGTTCEPYTGC